MGAQASSTAIHWVEQGLVPDAAVRVLLLEFDTLPSKDDDASPVVRFRLKRTLPFDADAAAVSYQVLSSERDMVRVLAVAMPADLRNEYESIVREAGYEPGAMLPSTLAALAALDLTEMRAQLFLNVDQTSITTAIVRGGVVLLHRTVDFARVEVTHAPEVLPEPMSSTPDAPIAAAADAQAEFILSEIEHLNDAEEIARAISVSAAYYEDTLSVLPQEILVSGSWPVAELEAIAQDATGDAVRLREIIQAMDLLAEATSAPRNLLAGVRGALRG